MLYRKFSLVTLLAVTFLASAVSRWTHRKWLGSSPNTPTGVVTPNSDFGVATGALGSRTVQLQARFSF